MCLYGMGFYETFLKMELFICIYFGQFPVYNIHMLKDYELEKREKAFQLSKKLFFNSTDRINFMHQYLRK